MAEKKYWKGLEELNQTPEFIELAQQEFPNEIPVNMFDDATGNSTSNRRDFLKVVGFSLTAATIAASCDIPVRRVAPYIFKPEDITPGVATWYASSYINGGDYCSILVKTREGRPIKIEGNRESKITQGGTSARVQASVLSLYDTARFKNPMVRKADNFDDSTWEEIDTAIKGKLEANPNVQIRILTSTIISPSTKKVFAEFSKKYPNTKVYTYDAVSSSGMLMANAATKGIAALPDYDFSKAKCIVSFDADFLGTWLSPIEYTKGYVKTRKVSAENREMSRHYQIESRLSLTGSNADYRVAILPSQLGIAVLNLYDAITGSSVSAGVNLNDEKKQGRIAEAADWLKKNAGQSLVVCGSNDKNIQLVINAINDALGNYGKTISFDNASMQRQGMDSDVKTLLSEINSVDVVMVHSANPVYDHPMGKQIAEALSKVSVSISFANSMDETSENCKFICPDHHYLESWNDAEPKKGIYSFAQPTIKNLFETRQMQDSLLTWAGTGVMYHDFMIQNWADGAFANELDKAHAFNKVLQCGVYQPDGTGSSEMTSETMTVRSTSDSTAVGMATIMTGSAMTSDVSSAASKVIEASKKGNGLEVQLYEKVGLGDGRYANNPWLHEMPDPVSKITWDNYLNVSPEWARKNDYEHGDVVKVSANGVEIQLPISIQPGQAYGSGSIAVGYGRTVIGKAGEKVGANAFALVDATGDTSFYTVYAVNVSKTGDNNMFSQTQTHFSLNDGIAKRKIVKETTLAEYKKNAKAGNEDRDKILEELDTFYPDYFAKKNGFNWGMNIDLNSCTGCGACVVACNAENNIPVVGKNEVRRSHEMHWMRIDRYYAGEDAENPEVVFQPMLCQHCENAPCENVCPVGATNHSSEGFNQMAYNRCIGTRYCANNCPYKVRRFNWFDYGGEDTFGHFNDPKGTTNLGMLEDLTRMVLNPDVTVRSRGVIEKCSFCVQRIQENKLNAKKESRELGSNEVKTACQTGCPADAIVFGNMFDQNSDAYKLNTTERAYGVIEENHWLPSVLYLTKVRNKDAQDHVHEKALDIMDLYNYH